MNLNLTRSTRPRETLRGSFTRVSFPRRQPGARFGDAGEDGKAKLRVKSQIFSSDIDHHVAVQYTPFIGDEKRDYVEYTSEAFLSQLHTMATYTRCSDSVLCAPLYIDVCCLLDYFSREEGVSVDSRGGDVLFIQGARGSGWSIGRLLGAATGAGTRSRWS